MNTLSRRNFLLSGFWLFAGLVMGRASSTNPAGASHPPEYDRAPLPDLAGEITTDECLTRDQIERVTEMALERACPVLESSIPPDQLALIEESKEALHRIAGLPTEEELRLKLLHMQINPPYIVKFRGAPIIEDVSMEPGQVYFLSENQRIAGYPNFVETWTPEFRR